MYEKTNKKNFKDSFVTFMYVGTWDLKSTFEEL